MAKHKPPAYFYRAFFKPNSLDVFEGFETGLDLRGCGLGYTQAWHKGASDISPFAVYNEFIAAEIGHFLRLPIPPFAVTYTSADETEQPLFSSLDFNFSRASLPPVIPEICCDKLAALSAGVVAFDILIANGDRHDANLVTDKPLDPKRMHLWDHEQSLLGGFDLVGIDRLNQLQNRLGITGGKNTGGTAHALLPHLSTCQHLFHWAGRIAEIPLFFVEEICAEAAHYGLDKQLADALALFLRDRTARISQLINANRPAFPKIADWPAQAELP